MEDAHLRREQLIQKLITQHGVFTFFPPGEEKPLAHHQSKRRPAEVYAGAALSPYFCNLRTSGNAGGKAGTLDESSVTLIGECLLDAMLKDDKPFKTVAGIPNAGDPIAAAVVQAALRRGIPLKSIGFRKDEGGDGRQFARLVVDDPTPVDAVVDDVITMADVKFRFLKQIGRTSSGDKVPLYVLVDRAEGGLQILRALGYEATPVLSIGQILEVCLAFGKIDRFMADRVQSYANARRLLVNEKLGEIVADLQTSSY